MCPQDSFREEGVACDSDSNLCTDEQCDGEGSCGLLGELDCDDESLCTQDSCVSSSGCINEAKPAEGCNLSAGKVQLLIVDSLTNDADDSVQVKWTKGSLGLSELGTPSGSTDYGLCVYDANGEVLSLSVPGGGSCGDTPCWTLKGAGYKYSDKRKPAVNDGVQSIVSKSSSEGKASLQMKGKGQNVPSIRLGTGLSYPVTVQIMTSDAACFATTFSHENERKNSGTKFFAARKAP